MKLELETSLKAVGTTLLSVLGGIGGMALRVDVWIPLAAAAIGGLLGIVASLLSTWLRFKLEDRRKEKEKGE